MEFLILLGICVVIVASVAWVGRRRTSAVDDPKLATLADLEAQRMRLDKGWNLRANRARNNYGHKDDGG
jgi:hypothetical protein